MVLSRSPSNQRTTYSWNGAGLLTQVRLPNGTVNTHVYNGDDLRVKRIDSNGTSQFIWQDKNVILETDTSNVIQTVYTLLPSRYGLIVSQRRSATSLWYHYDGTGSTAQLSDSGTSITDKYWYNGFGELVSSQLTSTNSYRFIGSSGYYFDSGQSDYYLRMRFYSPTLGRFLSRDRLEIYERSFQSRYSYADSNPTNITDPSGEVPGAIGVIGGLAAAFYGCVAAAGLGWPLTSEYFDDPNDWFKHCYFTCRISRGPCGSIMATILGLAKESFDQFCAEIGNPSFPCGDPSNKGAEAMDIVANGDGWWCAGGPIATGPCTGLVSYLWNGSCYDCCNKKYPQGQNPRK